MTTKPLKQSETRTIRRSQIMLNPVNPKRHSEKNVKLQKKNLQKVGFLGGVVWNERSGNLVDGHRRIMAMDLYYKYDGTAATDYEIKVEVADLDDKEEKQQLAYMAVGNTKPDIDLLANFVPDIDFNDIGLSDKELSDILAMGDRGLETVSGLLDGGLPAGDGGTSAAPVVDLGEELGLSYDERKEQMKEVKQRVKEQAHQRRQDEMAFITLSFSTFDAKADFCDLLGISTDEKYAKGEDVIRLIS